MNELFLGTAKTFFYSFITSIIILFVGFSIGFLGKKLISRILQEIELNKWISKMGMNLNIESLLSNLVLFLIYLATFFFFFRQLGITSIVFYLIFGIIAVIAVLAFFVGLKGFIPNFFMGIYLKRKNKIKEGKKIEINGIKGIVKKSGLSEVLIETERKDILHVPYVIINKSK